MSAGQCLPINSVLSHPYSTPIVSYWRLVGIILLCFMVGRSSGLRLTNMNAPLVADLRQDMELDCHFNMGSEELYAVKWYKDDHEFFRYMPHSSPNTKSFPVAGVHLVLYATNCSQEHCKVRLTDLTRDHSGGAYRCEISSEAPAFRLASETHNVTVAALPRENPRIEGLTTSYSEGDPVEAKCVSDPADPAPILSWYINGHQAPTKSVGEMLSSETRDGTNHLVSRSLTLRFVAERKHSREDGSIELRCVSSLPGVPLPPQVTTLTVPLRLPNAQVINNQKLHWFNMQSAAPLHFPSKILFFTLFLVSTVRWMMQKGC